MNHNPKFISVVFFGAFIWLSVFLNSYRDIMLAGNPIYVVEWIVAAIWLGIFLTITKIKTKKPLNVYLNWE